MTPEQERLVREALGLATDHSIEYQSLRVAVDRIAYLLTEALNLEAKP